MEKSSYFIKDKALFGSFPTQESVDDLEANGVRTFLDLTCDGESKIKPYTTKYTYLRYPIPDRRVPSDRKSFAKLILKMATNILNLRNGEMIYVHCKGGHGRSGVVVACLLCYLFDMTPVDALQQTTKYHSKRSIMRDKWRKLGSPQTRSQKSFVCKFFDPLYFYKAYKTGYTVGLSNFSLHPVEIKNLGRFPTSEAAFQAYKDPKNAAYVKIQENAVSPAASKHIGRRCALRSDWYNVRYKVMYRVVKKKFRQNDSIRENLLNSGLRPIVEHTRNDSYWGNSGNGSGKNMLGKILTRVRNEMYVEDY